MLNQIILVGRLVQDPEIKELENGVKTSYITLAVKRSYKNLNGEHDIDFITCRIWNGITDSVKEYCEKGDLVSIKGRVTKLNNEDLEIVAEKVTFLSKRKEEKNGK